MKRSRVSEVLIDERLRWRQQETWFGEREDGSALPSVDPEFAQIRGIITELSTALPSDAIANCLDEMGPESAKSFPGQRVVRAVPDAKQNRPVERATQETDYGRRGKGNVFGAFQSATGEAFTLTSGGRTIINWVDFLGRVDDWIPVEN